MKTTKLFFGSWLIISALFVGFSSCEEENPEGEIGINFKDDAGYVHTDTSIAGGTAITIAAEADTEKKKDPLIKFNISESVNGAAATTVYDEDIDNELDYEHDFAITLGTTVGETHKYTCTITNKDGVYKQVSLTVTIL